MLTEISIRQWARHSIKLNRGNNDMINYEKPNRNIQIHS